MSRNTVNANAGLYRCVPCKEVDRKATYGTMRVRVREGNVFGLTVPASGQRMIALCDAHANAYKGARRVDGADGDAAVLLAVTETAAYVSVGVAREAAIPRVWATIAPREFATLRKIARAKTHDEAAADDAYVILSDDFVDRVAEECARRKCDPADVPADVREGILSGLFSAMVRKNAEGTGTGAVEGYAAGTVYSLDFAADEDAATIGQAIAATRAAEDSADTFREAVLSLMSETNAQILRDYANRSTPDAREATRNEPTHWAQGRMVPLTGASDVVREAATEYVEALAYAKALDLV